MGKMINCREYRGRDKNGEWHFGSLVMAGLSRDEPYIVPYANWGDDGDFSETVAHKVDLETVGQFAGVVLDEKRKIFVGDIIRVHSGRGYGYNGKWIREFETTYVVKENWFEMYLHGGVTTVRMSSYYKGRGPKGERQPLSILKNPENYCEWLGNIFDNPELLEVK